MSEYMVQVWGGAWNDGANPSIERDLGIKEGYHYFSTDKEKDDFLKLISREEYRKQGLVSNIKYGEMSHKRTVFVGLFEYLGRLFIIHIDFGYEYLENDAEYMFLIGVYSCDCSRSIFIRREYGKDTIPELGCGEEIKLIDYHFQYED